MTVVLLVAACVAFAWPGSSPLVPRHAGHPGGERTWAWLFLVCEVAAFLAYVVGVALLRRRRPSLRAVAAVAAAVQLAPLGGPLLLSTDAWTYWDYGRLAAVHGKNPYREPPRSEPGDVAYPYVGARWRDESSVYGPGFTLASEPLALTADSSSERAAWLYKSLAALGILLAAVLAARLASQPVFALAFVGWNPLLAVHFAGGGHNDSWMAAAVCTALLLGATGRRQRAGVAWVAAASVKWIALVFLPLRALEARARGRPVGHLGFAAAAAAVTAAASARYGYHWLSAFGPLARNANHESRFALPHRLEELGLPHPAGIVLLAAGFVAAYAWLLREASRGRARLALCAALVLLATPYLAPWYVAWAVPLAAIEEDRLAQMLTLALCAYLLRSAVPL